MTAVPEESPSRAARDYLDALEDGGFQTELVIGPDAGHEWLIEGVDAVPAWFAAHP